MACVELLIQLWHGIIQPWLIVWQITVTNAKFTFWHFASGIETVISFVTHLFTLFEFFAYR